MRYYLYLCIMQMKKKQSLKRSIDATTYATVPVLEDKHAIIRHFDSDTRALY
jgi:hypothetical protein